MDIYCIDTSSLIEMKNKYPKDLKIFEKVWANMENLIIQGRLIAPVDVMREIEQGDDELKKWAKEKAKKIFVKPNKKQSNIVAKILEQYSFLANPSKPGPNADPWIIALAKAKNEEESEKLFPQKKYIVVTEESKSRQDRIPFVCKAYNIECINLIELFKREGW